MPVLVYSMVENQQVIDSENGQMIVLPCYIKGLTILPGPRGTDDTVLTRCLPFLPSLFANHSDTVNFPNATLRERRLRSVESFSTAYVDLIYRGPGPNDWVLEDITQAEYQETFATANGTNALILFYKKGYSTSTLFQQPTTGPAGGVVVSTSLQKFMPKRILRARGWLKRSEWNAKKASIREAICSINSGVWGSDAGGTWLFGGLTTATADNGNTRTVEVYLFNDPNGWYPVRAYLDIHGEHPPDSAKEAALRAIGRPDQGGYMMLNGLSQFSIYKERDFNAVFGFTPNDA